MNSFKKSHIVATGFNYIGFILLVIDAATSWYILPKGMNIQMFLIKSVALAFMLVGTLIFFFTLTDNKYQNVRKFLMINVFAYAIVISLIIYFIDIPYLWKWIAYVIVVILTEVFFLIKRK